MFKSPFLSTFSPPFNPGKAIPWYLSSNIPAANCVAAWQPKGAASYAASKINISNPGTYNAINGTTYPDWDATNGWTFTRDINNVVTAWTVT